MAVAVAVGAAAGGLRVRLRRRSDGRRGVGLRAGEGFEISLSAAGCYNSIMLTFQEIMDLIPTLTTEERQQVRAVLDKELQSVQVELEVADVQPALPVRDNQSKK